MSAEIKTMYDREVVVEDNRTDGWLALRFRGGHTSPQSVLVPRADFLAAVASELNVRIVPAAAIVVERSELPEVRVEDDRFITGDASWPQSLANQNVGAIRQDALQNLALAEYLTANPPVDEAQVSALADLMAEHVVPLRNENAARSLVRAGVRVVTS